jgi:hypothetical protein
LDAHAGKEMIFTFRLWLSFSRTCLNDDYSYRGLSSLVLSWELASTLKETKSRFDSAGVKLIAVGVGEPNKARMLAERVMFLCPPLSFQFLTVFLAKYYEALKE